MYYAREPQYGDPTSAHKAEWAYREDCKTRRSRVTGYPGYTAREVEEYIQLVLTPAIKACGAQAPQSKYRAEVILRERQWFYR